MTVCECGYEWGICKTTDPGAVYRYGAENEPHHCMKPIGHDSYHECECGAMGGFLESRRLWLEKNKTDNAAPATDLAL